MKRTFSVLVAALLVFTVVGQAVAYFDDSHLFRVVYKVGGVEVLNDLGTVSSVLVGGSFGNGSGLQINLGDFGTGTTWADLNVAYFAMDQSNNGGLGQIWASNQTALGTPKSGAIGAGGTFQSNYGSTQSYAQSIVGSGSGQVKAVASTSYPLSYYSLMNSSGLTVGQFGDFLAVGNGQANLAALATGGSVDLNLYTWNDALIVSDTFGTLAGVIRTELDGGASFGKTSVSASAPVVPVPAAVWLLGTGLIGLVGIRRRKAN